jgi:hypothetical protein
VNLFAVFPSGPVSLSFSGLTQALQKAGIMEALHASMGFLILAASIAVPILSFKQRVKSTRITSLMELAAVASPQHQRPRSR